MNKLEPNAFYVEGPNPGVPLTVAIALTTYSEPPDTDSGRHKFNWTEIGSVLHDAKYGSLREISRTAARDKLTELLLEMATTNAHLRGARAVVAVPGSDHDLSEVLAKDIAFGLDVPFVVARRRSIGGVPAKWRGSAKREYDITESLEGPVLIVDDFFRTGDSMRGVAMAAVRAGATECRGIVVAYTPPPA